MRKRDVHISVPWLYRQVRWVDIATVVTVVTEYTSVEVSTNNVMVTSLGCDHLMVMSLGCNHLRRQFIDKSIHNIIVFLLFFAFYCIIQASLWMVGMVFIRLILLHHKLMWFHKNHPRDCKKEEVVIYIIHKTVQRYYLQTKRYANLLQLAAAGYVGCVPHMPRSLLCRRVGGSQKLTVKLQESTLSLSLNIGI